MGRVVDVAIEAPEPFLGEQLVSEDMCLLVGARIDRLDTAIDSLKLKPQGEGKPVVVAAEDRKPNRAEQVRPLRNKRARVQHHAHAGVVGGPFDFKIGICNHSTRCNAHHYTRQVPSGDGHAIFRRS
ncbi:hypothetical protein [Bradyrhizobium sp. SZCCHNR2032]|uniref:hypothetical protein n=1 Tax=Bradyrhizobium sp. SZCCHNR2032 TaxID=3057384 RepID=UPI002915D062|nr:hypothetical protein [Bradyrhizobium sp. SZCCHNR2032]